MFRLQKLLLSEYHEIYEPLMVESPFTLVDAYGIGLRQYQIGLSSSMLLFGSDNFEKQGAEHCGNPNWQCEDQDAEIECFDLISLVPLQYARFNFYRKYDRCIMMLSVPWQEYQLAEDRPMIFEFGGHINKNYYFQTWRERVATIRTLLPRLGHINGASPFSSTDIQLDEVQHIAQVHVPHRPRRPQSVYSKCYSSAGGA